MVIYSYFQNFIVILWRVRDQNTRKPDFGSHALTHLSHFQDMQPLKWIKVQVHSPAKPKALEMIFLVLEVNSWTHYI